MTAAGGDAAPAPAISPSRAALAAGLGGFAVMSLELAAVRVLAPHFGDSAYVWTNVIGVILVALALGAFAGGRLADRPGRGGRDGGPGRLAVVFVSAAALAAVAPFAVGPLGGWLLPAGLALDDAMPALVRGSLCATMLVFAPPVLALGAVTPLLVATLARGSGSVGSASGWVAAWSTLGSLAGTFATTHLLVPEAGSRATIWIAAALLLLCAAICARRPVLAGVGAAVLGLPALPLGAQRPPAAGETLLAETESRYQFLQVVRRDGEPASTVLRINEGLDSFHSVRLDGSPFTGGLYYDYHVIAPWLAGDGGVPDGLRVLSLGAAAGTFERVFAAVHAGLRMDSVELDPDVVALGRRHFDAFGNDGRVFAGLDARVYVERAEARYHTIVVDAYERQIYIPAHVASREFFAAVHERLLDGGVVSVNAGGHTADDPVVRVIGRTMAAVFGEAWALHVPRSRNFVLVARRRLPVDPSVLEAVASTEPAVRAVLDVAADPARWRRIEPGAPVLVDDRPFLDTVQDRALRHVVAGTGPWPTGGTTAAAAVRDRAYERFRSGDHDGVRAALADAAEADGYLRLLAGDSRWLARDLEGARSEYRAGLARDGGGEYGATLRTRLADLEAELAPAALARSVARRNGWLAAGLALGLALAAAAVLRRWQPRPARAG